MNKKYLIWLGVGVAVAVGIYYLSKCKAGTGTGLNATGGYPAPEKHAFSGVVNRDTNLFKNANGQLMPMPVTMRKGEKIKFFAQADGMLKVDCDGIWIDESCVTIDPEYRNFTGARLEPEQDPLTGKIF